LFAAKAAIEPTNRALRKTSAFSKSVATNGTA
jgi:hypothetical protein